MSEKYGLVSFASAGTRASVTHVKTPPSFLMEAGAQAGWPSKPATEALTATSEAPRFTATSDSFTGWPPITSPSSETASKVRPWAARSASS